MDKFDIIRENVPYVDLIAVLAKKKVENALTELLNENKDYLNYICEGEFYDEIKNINIYNYATSDEGEFYLIEAAVHFDDGKTDPLGFGWETVSNIIVPIEYITDEDALKVAVLEWKEKLKEKQKAREIEKEKNKNLKEYKEYLRLKKKFTEDSCESNWKLYLDYNEDKDND